MLQAISSVKRNGLALYFGLKAGFKVFKASRSLDAPGSSLELLTPVILEDLRFARYEQELLGALHNPNVLNIAVTGSYGAGTQAYSDGQASVGFGFSTVAIIHAGLQQIPEVDVRIFIT